MYFFYVKASLSCSCGDTLASEIGTAFEKKSQAYLISNLRKVPKGFLNLKI